MGDAEWRQPASLLPKHPQAQHLHQQQQQQLQQQMHFHFNSADKESNSVSTSATSTATARPSSVHHLATHGFGGVDVGNTVGRRPSGMPPFHPHMPPVSPGSRSFTSQQSPSAAANQSAPGHSRSLSQPAGFFSSLDQLPPLSPPLYNDASSPSSVCEQGRGEASTEVRDASGLPRSVASPSTTPVPLMRSNSGGLHASESLPPRKAHRRSHSDVSFAFMESYHSRDLPPSLPPRPYSGNPNCSTSPGDIIGLLQQQQGQFIKQELECNRQLDGKKAVAASKKSDEESMEALIGEYINFEAIDAMNSSEMDEKHDDSRASGTRNSGVDTSENESESSVNESGGSTQAFGNMQPCFSNKRRGVVDMAIDTGLRHSRSLSVDSCLIGKVDFGSESPRLPPSPHVQPPCLTRVNSLDGTSDKIRAELRNAELSGTEVKKIMANTKLAEIAAQDPKRAKRIWANRQSAARSKERKQKYISELEYKVQTLQTEATTLSTQLTVLQRDSTELTSHNRELKLKLQAMEQQAHLRDALNDALSAEVQRLKLATTVMGSGQPPAGLPQPTLNPQFFQFQHQHQLQQMQQHSSMPFSFQSQDKQSKQEQQREAEHYKQCQRQVEQNISGPNKEPMDSTPMSDE